MQWEGPFVVTSKMGSLDYRIDNNGKLKQLYIDMLRLYIERVDTINQSGNEDVLSDVVVALENIDHKKEETENNLK